LMGRVLLGCGTVAGGYLLDLSVACGTVHPRDQFPAAGPHLRWWAAARGRHRHHRASQGGVRVHTIPQGRLRVRSAAGPAPGNVQRGPAGTPGRVAPPVADEGHLRRPVPPADRAAGRAAGGVRVRAPADPVGDQTGGRGVHRVLRPSEERADLGLPAVQVQETVRHRRLGRTDQLADQDRHRESEIKDLQRRQAHCTKRSREWQRLGRHIARIRTQVKDRTENWARHTAKQLAADYDVLALGDLHLTNMTKSAKRNDRQPWEERRGQGGTEPVPAGEGTGETGDMDRHESGRSCAPTLVGSPRLYLAGMLDMWPHVEREPSHPGRFSMRGVRPYRARRPQRRSRRPQSWTEGRGRLARGRMPTPAPTRAPDAPPEEGPRRHRACVQGLGPGRTAPRPSGVAPDRSTGAGSAPGGTPALITARDPKDENCPQTLRVER
jgi:hypothetical protein